VALALAEGKAQEAHENRQVVTAARRYRKCLLDKDFQQFFETFLPVGLRFAFVQLTL